MNKQRRSPNMPPNLPHRSSRSAARRKVLSPVVSAQRAWQAWKRGRNTPMTARSALAKSPWPAVPARSLEVPVSGPKMPDQKLPAR